MKISGTIEEIGYIKKLIERADHDCTYCIYREGCETDTCDTCHEYITKQIKFEVTK